MALSVTAGTGIIPGSFVRARDGRAFREGLVPFGHETGHVGTAIDQHFRLSGGRFVPAAITETDVFRVGGDHAVNLGRSGTVFVGANVASVDMIIRRAGESDVHVPPGWCWHAEGPLQLLGGEGVALTAPGLYRWPALRHPVLAELPKEGTRDYLAGQRFAPAFEADGGGASNLEALFLPEDRKEPAHFHAFTRAVMGSDGNAEFHGPCDSNQRFAVGSGTLVIVPSFTEHCVNAVSGANGGTATALVFHPATLSEPRGLGDTYFRGRGLPGPEDLLPPSFRALIPVGAQYGAIA
jgi:hypothetical protein